MSVSDVCFEKIKEEKIKPKSKFWFSSYQMTLKLLIVILLFAAILCLSIILISIGEIDFDVYRYLNIGFVEFTLRVVPYFLIFLLFLTSFLAIKLFRSTEFGYRLNLSRVLFWGLSLVTIGTTFMFASNSATALYDGIETGKEIEKVLKSHKYMVWSNPEKGLLAGKIERINDLELLEVRDFNSKQWLVNTNKIFKSPKLIVGEHYKFLGLLDEKSSIFFASEVRHWK